MLAIQLCEFGEAAPLVLVDVPDCVPGEDDVLVAVKAAGINYADILMRRGKYSDRLKPPYTPGFEAAGEVLATGKNATQWKVGERVMGTVPRHICGCYAEKAVMPAWLLLPVPDNFTFEEAAAFPEAFITAHLALRLFGKLAAGESVLIHAAAGGVGTAAVQMARALGARVFATASSDEKLNRTKQLGATEQINYAALDFEEEVAKRTDGQGVDLILESVGGEAFEKSLRCLRPLGRLVVYGASSGKTASVKSSEFSRKTITVSGFSFGALTLLRPSLIRQAMQAVSELVVEENIRPVVGKTFPLADARAAQDYITERRNIGKVVLQI